MRGRLQAEDQDQREVPMRKNPGTRNMVKASSMYTFPSRRSFSPSKKIVDEESNRKSPSHVYVVEVISTYETRHLDQGYVIILSSCFSDLQVLTAYSSPMSIQSHVPRLPPALPLLQTRTYLTLYPDP